MNVENLSKNVINELKIIVSRKNISDFNFNSSATNDDDVLASWIVIPENGSACLCCKIKKNGTRISGGYRQAAYYYESEDQKNLRKILN